MNELQRRVADEVLRSERLETRVNLEGRGAATVGAACESPAASEVGDVEKPQGFFNELGAPEKASSVEKLGGFFNSWGSLHALHPNLQQDAAVPSAGKSPAPNRGGRPTIFTPELKERFEMLLAVGMSRRQAAAYLGIDHTTVAKLAARDQEFRLNLQIAEDQATVNPMLTILSESRKNWRAAAWLLKYRGSLPVERVEKTDEEKELEHQRQLAEDAREAERSKRRAVSIHEQLRCMQTGLLK